MQTVTPGETWSWFASSQSSARSRFVILAIDGATATIRYERTARERAVPLRNLRLNRRGARREICADGKPSVAVVPKQCRMSADDALDIRGDWTSRERRVARMVRAGLTEHEVARELRLSRGFARTMIARTREIWEGAVAE